MDGVRVIEIVCVHIGGGDVGIFVGVVAAANADISLHLLELGLVESRHLVRKLLVHAHEQLALYARIAQRHEGVRADGVRLAYDAGDELIVRFRAFDKQVLALFQRAGIIHEVMRQSLYSFIE